MRRPAAGGTLAGARPGTRTIVTVALILTAVWIAMVIYLGVRFFSVFNVGLTSCLPADFPHYPGASLASIVVTDPFGDCTTQYRTRDSAGDVQSFFQTHLNEGDWTVTGVNDQLGLIQFRRTSRSWVRGYVRILSFPGQQTQFQIQIRQLRT